ncbi:hypothetical protein, partial [Alkalicoccobacillus gibsonii]|uniref:hypothetical protein n=1 Tax=Alkalicoccobacillus gibsonii TaxID=79881 RepID=UPI0023612C5F
CGSRAKRERVAHEEIKVAQKKSDPRIRSTKPRNPSSHCPPQTLISHLYAPFYETNQHNYPYYLVRELKKRFEKKILVNKTK